MIRVCENCSNVDVDKLEEIAPDNVAVICIGECGKHEGKSFGFINDELVIRDSEADFFEAVKAALQSAK